MKKFKRVELYYFNIMELAIIKEKEGFTIPGAVEWCEANNVQTVKRICNQHFKSKGQDRPETRQNKIVRNSNAQETKTRSLVKNRKIFIRGV